MKTQLALTCTFTLAVTLSACGGGGGGTSMPNPTPTPITVTGTAVAWASDNRTRTTTTTYSDGTNTSTSVDVPPVESGAVFSTVAGANSTSALINTFGNGVVQVLQDGSSVKPFLQATLTVKNIADPNTHVATATQAIDLRWGTKAAPYVLPQTDNVQASMTSNTITGQFNSFSGVSSPLLTLPSRRNFTTPLDQSTSLLQGVWITPDVKAAWAQGWTGAGVKIGVLDDFTANNVSEFLHIPTPTGCSVSNGFTTCSTSAGVLFRQTHGDP